MVDHLMLHEFYCLLHFASCTKEASQTAWLCPYLFVDKVELALSLSLLPLMPPSTIDRLMTQT